MKYENFEAAKATVERIDKYTKLLNSLGGDNISIKVMDGQFTEMTIGSWSSCEHECRHIAEMCIRNLKEYYEEELRVLYIKLDAL